MKRWWQNCDLESLIPLAQVEQIFLCYDMRKMLKEMEIRHATEKDFQQIMEIYEYARHFMSEHGNPNQWGPQTGRLSH